ncbi:hypothetical protein EpCFBP13511_10685 [Erwinia persicina]|uniref:Uncharacterized protein n=1 Tax=Erwinia persicina TaxID=55211 RepID=A0A4U3F9P8_9GAMM|nr:hypothetical protein EpCFBP13511_10685 [Erwinia persicina]
MAEGKYKVSQKGEDGGVPGTLSGMPGLRAKKLKGRLPPARPFCYGIVWVLCSAGKAISPACRPSSQPRITGPFPARQTASW